jgi:hypothetical protein
MPTAVSISALTYDAGSGARLRAVARVPRDIVESFKGRTVEFVAVFLNDQGNLLSLQRNALELARVRANDLVLTAGIPARPGRIKCRLILRDLETGQSILATTDATVRDAVPGGLRLFSPLLLVRGPGAFLVDGVPQGTQDVPGWREVYGYDPSVFAPVVGNDPVEDQMLVVAVPISGSIQGSSDLAFKINIVNSATGEDTVVPFTQTISGRIAIVEVRQFEIAAGSWAPGNYLLYVHAQDRATGALASTYAPVVIGSGAKQR